VPNLVDQAICIRQWDWSETSQTVSLFCRGYGVLRGLAKGARRERSSFSGGIDMLACGEVVAVVKPDRDLQTLTQWTLLQMFRRPHDELETNLYGLAMAELVHRMLPPAVPHERLHDSMLDTLERIEEGERPAPLFLRFFLMLLRETGHEPRFEVGAIPHARLAFDPADGGIVDCSERPKAWRMRPETAFALHQTALGEPPENLDPDSVDRAIRLLAAYARTVVGDALLTLHLALEPRPSRSFRRNGG
jgi:DNA repair protein RecO (recombination protein O)